MKKILNYGSLNIDKTFSMDHIVRPGETLAAKSLELFPGGKGLNQSVALAKAEGNVYHAGKIGADGEFLIDVLKEAGVHTEYIGRSEGQSGQALIQVDSSGQNCILLYHGANFEIAESDFDQVLSHFGPGDLLVLQNEINDIDALMKKAAARGMEIVFNPSPIGPEIARCDLSLVSWFLLNEVEGRELTGESDPEKITDILLRRYPNAHIVLTLGQDGVVYRDGEKTARHGIFKVPVVDTTAAGDTFTGFFLAGMAAAEPVERALRVASAASAIAVSRKGAAVSIPTLREVLDSDLMKEEPQC